MALPTYPSSDLDVPERLLAQLGSFWSGAYRGDLPVASVVAARGRLARQAASDAAELRAAVARATAPVLHTRLWHPVKLLASRRTGTATYPAPAGLADVSALTNRLTEPSRVLTRGLDFSLAGGLLTFTADPFADPLVGTQDLLSGTAVADRQALLWAYRAGFDTRNVYTQFGYALGLDLGSSDASKALVNAVYDALADGGTAWSVDRVLALAAGVPLARGGETVTQILTDSRSLWVVTDKNAYPHHPLATPTVAVGDALAKGQSLTDTLRFFEFGRGVVPSAADLPALTLTPGLLGAGYSGGLTWSNVAVAVAVDEADPSGYTKVSWDLGGAPADVTAFWDAVQAAGAAKGSTLAMAMDLRPQRPLPGQPTAATLPATVNPLAFLVQNVLRDNAYVASLTPSTFGPEALGTAWLDSVLRQVVPAHVACIVLSTG